MKSNPKRERAQSTMRVSALSVGIFCPREDKKGEALANRGGALPAHPVQCQHPNAVAGVGPFSRTGGWRNASSFSGLPKLQHNQT